MVHGGDLVYEAVALLQHGKSGRQPDSEVPASVLNAHEHDVGPVSLLRKALREDPSESFAVSFGSQSSATLDYCAACALAVPPCSSVVGRENASLTGYQKRQYPRFELFGTPANSTHLLLASANGKQCSANKQVSDGSAFSIVLDGTMPASDSSTADCDEAWFNTHDPKVHRRQRQQSKLLMERGKLKILSFNFSFEANGEAKNGTLWYTVILPEASCPRIGCQAVFTLHGLHVTQFYPPDDPAKPPLWKFVTPLTRTLCANEYSKLRSIIVAPILDNDTFPGHEHPDLQGSSWKDVSMSSYTWYDRRIDMWAAALIPLLKAVLSKDAPTSLPIDPNRVQLHGHSAGGVGAVLGGLRFPNYFASVTATSPCINTRILNQTIFSTMDDLRAAWSVSPRLSNLHRLLLFIGEGDVSSTCLYDWASFFAALGPDVGMQGTHIQLRFMLNSAVVDRHVMGHNVVPRYAWAEADRLLWTDDVSKNSALFSMLSPEYGCPASFEWVTLLLLVVFMIVRRWIGGFKFVKRFAAQPVRHEDVDTVTAEDQLQFDAVQDVVLTAQGQLELEVCSICTFPELIGKEASVAIVGSSDDDVQITFDALSAYLSSDNLVTQLAQGLRYAVSMPAGWGLACIVLAAMHRGSASPIDPSMTVAELAATFVQLKIQVAICCSGKGGEAVRFVASKQSIGVINVTMDQTQGKMPILAPAIARPLSPDAGIDWDPANPSRIVLLLRTSGTTSKGKVVPFTFGRLSRAAQYNSHCIGLSPADVGVSVMPFYHIANISVTLLSSLFAKSTLVVMDGAFDANCLKCQIERQDGYAPTWYFAVPSMHAALLNEVKNACQPMQHKLRLVRSAGSTLESTLAERLLYIFDAAVTPCYGMTETCEITCPPKDYKLERKGSVGPPMTCTVAVENRDGSRHGEIFVKGDLVMSAYEWDGVAEHDPNRDAWTEHGYFRTGDVGYLDAGGWLYLTGRCKEMINRGGETLSPYEVEEVLQRSADIAVAVAFAAPHPSLGECIAVACVLRDGVPPRQIGLGPIRKMCELQGLRPVMLPEVAIYCEQAAFPMTRTGKYIRTGLANTFGLTADLTGGGNKAFIFDSTTCSLRPEPDAEDQEDEFVMNSLGQLRKASRQAHIEQDVINALYGVVIVNVLLNHWLPHDMSGIMMPSWATAAITTFRSDKALMSLMFGLGGYGTANAESIGRNMFLLGMLYFAMGLSQIFPLTSSMPTFQRWFLLWFVIGMALCYSWAAMRQRIRLPERVWRASPGIALYFLAPCLAHVPDTLGSSLGLPSVLMDPWHYWSIGHKVYWLGWFMTGFCCGRNVSAVAWDIVDKAPFSLRFRFFFLCVAGALAFTMVVSNVPYVRGAHRSLDDWPHFFDGPFSYMMKLLLEWFQVMCLTTAIGRGVGLLRTIGASILGTFAVHMYFNPGILAFAQSRLFQDLDVMPVVGGCLQMAVLLLFPIAFAYTIGAVAWWTLLYVCTIIASATDVLNRFCKRCYTVGA